MPSQSRRSSGTSVVVAAGRLDLVVELFEPADGAGHGDHMRAAPAGLERRLIADAARCAGDEDDLAGEVLDDAHRANQLASRISDSVLGSDLLRPIRSVSVVG